MYIRRGILNMGIIEAAVYGLIQGIAEFLPISSSGHLALAQNLFGTENIDSDTYLAFNVLLHLATLLAVCIVYRSDILKLIKGFFTLAAKLFTGRIKQGLDFGEKLFVMLVVATLPLVPAALLGADESVGFISSVSWVIGVLLIINGAVLWISDRLSRGAVILEGSRIPKALIPGLTQVIGLLPGISRSGITITGGLLAGFKREDAVRLSFLMSIPAILGSCVLELPEFFASGLPAGTAPAFLTGAAVAAVSGFFAIKLLQYLAKNRGFAVFSVYCITIGAAAIIADAII